MEEYKFKTKRFEVYYWSTEFISAAEIHHHPRQAWPIAVAVDVRGKKSRNQLIRQAITNATTKLIRGALSMQRYILFVGDIYYPGKAIDDLVGHYDSLDEATAIGEELIKKRACYCWYSVVDQAILPMKTVKTKTIMEEYTP